MYAENNDFLDRPDALPLNLIWNFETTSGFRGVKGIMNGEMMRIQLWRQQS
jgi:hypothetical protein